jgi:hypothetical protein
MARLGTHAGLSVELRASLPARCFVANRAPSLDWPLPALTEIDDRKAVLADE